MQITITSGPAMPPYLHCSKVSILILFDVHKYGGRVYLDVLLMLEYMIQDGK